MELDEFRKQLQNKQLTYSQCLQDVFALIINDYKTSGSFIDIGSSTPDDMYNNSILLQLFNWKGICVDLGNYESYWNNYPNATFYSMDCCDKENIKFIMDKSPEVVDFLSFDIDDATIEGLKLVDFNKTKFKSICIEHNKYLGDRGEQRHGQREILEANGYKLLIKNWHNFEDWWVHPELVNLNKIEYLTKYSENKFTY